MPIQQTTLTHESWCTDHSSDDGHEDCSTKRIKLADGRDGPVTNCTAPVVYVDLSGDILSGPDARRIAAALLDAADVWDTAPQGEDDPLVTGPVMTEEALRGMVERP